VCKARRGRRACPRWGGLYAIVAAGLTGAAVVGALTGAGSVRTALFGVPAAATLLAASRWLARNRVALDLLDWCDCAAATVRVRVVRERPPRAARRPQTLRRPETTLRV